MQDDKKEMIVSVSMGSVVKVIAILLGFWALWVLRDLVLIIITAVVVASSVEPAVIFLGKYRIHRIPAVLLVYASLVALLAGLFYGFMPSLIREAAEFLQKIPVVSSGINLNPLAGDSNQLKSIAHITESTSAQDVLLTISQIFSTSKGFVATAGSVFGGLFSAILIAVLSFYFAMQERGIESFIKIVIPARMEGYAVDLWERSKVKIGKWMQGQLLLAVLIFILVYLGLTIFGVPYALLLALLAGILEIIPVFGPIMSAIPGVALAFTTGGTSLALIIAGFYLLVQQFESHLIYPLVVRKIVGVPPILVILALIIGFQLAGVLGVLISVPVAAALMEVIGDAEKKRSHIV